MLAGVTSHDEEGKGRRGGGSLLGNFAEKEEEQEKIV